MGSGQDYGGGEELRQNWDYGAGVERKMDLYKKTWNEAEIMGQELRSHWDYGEGDGIRLGIWRRI